LKNVRRKKNDNPQKVDGYVVNNSTESVQVEVTTPETITISDTTENNIMETVVPAEDVTTTDTVTGKRKSKALAP
jgi:hypothetical protein